MFFFLTIQWCELHFQCCTAATCTSSRTRAPKWNPKCQQILPRPLPPAPGSHESFGLCGFACSGCFLSMGSLGLWDFWPFVTAFYLCTVRVHIGHNMYQSFVPLRALRGDLVHVEIRHSCLSADGAISASRHGSPGSCEHLCTRICMDMDSPFSPGGVELRFLRNCQTFFYNVSRSSDTHRGF